MEGEMGEYVEELEAAILDILCSNNQWYEIMEFCGCSKERAEELEELHDRIECSYNNRHNINK
jgi:hypothetical protein